MLSNTLKSSSFDRLKEVLTTAPKKVSAINFIFFKPLFLCTKIEGIEFISFIFKSAFLIIIINFFINYI
jgi:hypothetical protein